MRASTPASVDGHSTVPLPGLVRPRVRPSVKLRTVRPEQQQLAHHTSASGRRTSHVLPCNPPTTLGGRGRTAPGTPHGGDGTERLCHWPKVTQQDPHPRYAHVTPTPGPEYMGTAHVMLSPRLGQAEGLARGS